MSVRAGCWSCGSRNTTALETRAGVELATLRRRVCMDCNTVFTTREVVVLEQHSPAPKRRKRNKARPRSQPKHGSGAT